jgi:hypothetical protein
MTSTTTTISAETNPQSDTIRLAAAYDDKTHEGVCYGLQKYQRIKLPKP